MSEMTREYHAAQREVEEAMRRVRNANDELSEAHTAMKVASARLRKATRSAPSLEDLEQDEGALEDRARG